MAMLLCREMFSQSFKRRSVALQSARDFAQFLCIAIAISIFAFIFYITEFINARFFPIRFFLAFPPAIFTLLDDCTASRPHSNVSPET